ncbi:dCTP deaminase [Halobaculum roseum]|uniref:dCTP deaminase n=1 Tax=Halobaculum roseum TaxID=2175149 RepID=A0ABD5MK06_9EURY|nr:dCTP deaminase [Halobaculum roseum]QZY02855.1 dCTP deaminase [Halobaculum roseum]
MSLIDRLDDIVHEETQTEGPGIDLTLAGVHEIADPGAVDFGGGELADASFATIEPEKRDPDDDYGWWDLEPGTYLVTLNESLSGDDTVTLQPRTELVARGATHPTLRTASLPPVPLTVSRTASGAGDVDFDNAGGTRETVGLRLKENARVSTLLPE